MDYHKMLSFTSMVMAPNYPRRVGIDYGDTFRQYGAANMDELVSQMEQGNAEGNDCYISVYSFPSAHSKDGGIPLVDTIFLDFDIASDAFYRMTEAEEDWKDAMDELLLVVSDVAEWLVTNGRSDYWRAVLSGHKGLHLYLDVPALDGDLAAQDDYRTGLRSFVSVLEKSLNSRTPLDLSRFMDADSADLSRLCRFPNTRHPTATARFGEDRYCVPVEMKELIGLDAEGYAELTRSPRFPQDGAWSRTASESAAGMIRQHIFDARISSGSSSKSSASVSDNNFKSSRVLNYQQEHNGKMNDLDDVWSVLVDTPCIYEYYKRDDQFAHRRSSHMMELFTMTHMIHAEIPYDLIVEFFDGMDGFSRVDTEKRLDELIGRNYQKVNCETIWQEAPQFCLRGCPIYEESH